MGMEASVADLVRSVVNRGRSGFYRRRGRKFYRAGRVERESAVAFSMRRLGLFLADDVRGGRKAVCSGGCRDGAVYVWFAVKTCERETPTLPNQASRKCLTGRLSDSCKTNGTIGSQNSNAATRCTCATIRRG